VAADDKRLRADVGMTQGLSSGMAIEAIQERDARDERMLEMAKAQKAMGELKRARLVEGPTDHGVIKIS